LEFRKITFNIPDYETTTIDDITELQVLTIHILKLVSRVPGQAVPLCHGHRCRQRHLLWGTQCDTSSSIPTWYRRYIFNV